MTKYTVTAISKSTIAKQRKILRLSLIHIYAKKYRHGLEYGSARWGTREDIAPYVDPVFQNNVILAVLGSGGRLDIIRRSVLVRMILSSNFGAMNGSISLGPPHRAEPYSCLLYTSILFT